MKLFKQLFQIVIICLFNFKKKWTTEQATEFLKFESERLQRLGYISTDTIDDISKFIKCRADVNVRDNFGNTLVITAAEYNQIEIIQLLLKAKADVNVAGAKYGMTPLHYASQNSNMEIIQLLLKAKADVNMADVGGFTPLYIASRNGEIEIVRLLLKSKANEPLAKHRETVLRQ